MCDTCVKSSYYISVVYYFLPFTKSVKMYITVITLTFLHVSRKASKQWFWDYIVFGLGWGNEFRANDGIPLEPHIFITTL